MKTGDLISYPFAGDYNSHQSAVEPGVRPFDGFGHHLADRECCLYLPTLTPSSKIFDPIWPRLNGSHGRCSVQGEPRHRGGPHPRMIDRAGPSQWPLDKDQNPRRRPSIPEITADGARPRGNVRGTNCVSVPILNTPIQNKYPGPTE
jgi:hypothetical protein